MWKDASSLVHPAVAPLLDSARSAASTALHSLASHIEHQHQHQHHAGVPFIAPNANGGRQLDDAGDGFGEPINVIISALSDPRVLTDDGFLAYSQSLGFSFEAFGIHRGTLHTANLGDGNGSLNQKIIFRQDFGLPDIGSLIESLAGGSHFRMWRQNGPTGNTGALFLAASREESGSKHHNIVPNGYDIGRDELVAIATKGITKRHGVKYSATAQSITGLLPPGSAGVNHGIPTDGKVILLTVSIVS